MKTRFIQGIGSVFSHRRTVPGDLSMKVYEQSERVIDRLADVFRAEVRFGAEFSVRNDLKDSDRVRGEVPLVIQKQLAEQVYGEVRAELKRLFPTIHELKVYNPECAHEVEQVVHRILEMTDPR